MTSLADEIIEAIESATDWRSIWDELLNAAFLFEKARGMAPCGWSEEVELADITIADAARLRLAVVDFVQRTGCGSFILSKCGDQTGLKPLYTDVVRRQFDGDLNEMFQAMIALSNRGESIFPRGSASADDTDINRQLAKQYLANIRETKA